MSDRETIESTIRQRTPTIEVCDNGACQTWSAGDPAYEAWVARTVDEHVAAAGAVQEAATQSELAGVVRAYLDDLAANETLLVNGIATLKGPNPPATIAALRTYVTAMAEMTLDHNRGLDRLIRYLVRTGVIG